MNQQGFTFGLEPIDMSGFSFGNTMPAPTYRPAPSSGVSSQALSTFGMNTGTGLTSAAGNMPPVGGNNGSPAGGGWFKNIGGVEGLASIAQGLASLGQVYGAIQSVKLGKEQLALQKEAYQTNLANQRQSYNTSLEDRIRSRYVMEGRSSGEADTYLDKNKL